jgi:hypothetical protein
MSDTRTYACTPAQLTALSTSLLQHGLLVDLTKTGSVVSGKWDVAWTTSPGSITVTVVGHPFAEEGMFWAKVAAALGPLS